MKITVIGERCTIVDGQVFVGEAKRVYPVEFVFDDSWDGYTATAVFESAGSEPVSQLLVDGKCFVPWEVLIPNVRFRVGVFGVKDNVERPTIWTHYLPVAPGTSDAPEAQPDPTPGMYTQMLQLLNQHEQAEAIRVINEEARKDAEDVRQDAEANRAAAEAQRVASDNRREQVWESQVLAAGDAAKRAESAAKTAENAIKGVDEAATAAVKNAQIQLNQSVSQAQEQAVAAQESAEEAKRNATRVSGLIDSAYNAAAKAGEAENAAEASKQGAQAARDTAVDAAEHPPIPGENKCWMLWDGAKYVESNLPLPVGLDGKDGEDGDDGVGVDGITINEKKLVFTMTDGTKHEVVVPAGLAGGHVVQLAPDGADYALVDATFEQIKAWLEQSEKVTFLYDDGARVHFVDATGWSAAEGVSIYASCVECNGDFVFYRLRLSPSGKVVVGSFDPVMDGELQINGHSLFRGSNTQLSAADVGADPAGSAEAALEAAKEYADGVGGSGPQMQSDWTQLRDDKPDFIKHKPFGHYRHEHYWTRNGSTPISVELDLVDADGYPYSSQTLPTSWGVAADALVVRWNDVEYEVKRPTGGARNYEFLGAESADNKNGFPFTLTRAASTPDWTVKSYDKSLTAVEILIFGCTFGTDKIDQQFLPDVVWNDVVNRPFSATPGEIVVRELTLNPGAALGGGFGFDANVVSLELGKKYLFTCNGVDYPCEAVEHTMTFPGFGALSGIGLGNTTGTTGEPFTALYLDADQAATIGGIGILYLFDPSIAEATIMLRELVDLKRIPSGYLPEGIGGTTSWNDLEDKPFGEVEGAGRTEIFPPTELGPIENSGYPLADTIPLEAGAEYVVVWNGTEYTCIGLSYEGDEGVQLGVALGNLAAMNGDGDSGHPFAIVAVSSPELAAEFGFASAVAALDGSTTATLAIYAIGGGATVFPEATVNSTGEMVEGAIDLVEGGTYLVTWNGTVYECVCQAYQEDGMDIFCLGDVFTATQGIVGTGSTGEPFVVMGAPSMGVFMAMDFSGAETATLKIAKPGGSMVVKTLDAKYLPEGVPYAVGSVDTILPETQLSLGPDSSWSYCEVDGVLGLKAGEKYTVVYNGTEYEFVGTPIEGLPLVGLGNLRSAGGPDTGELIGIDEYPPYRKWVLEVYENGVTEATLAIYHNGEQIRELDPRCLPKGAIEAALPSVELVATFDDGTTKTYKLYGEVVGDDV